MTTWRVTGGAGEYQASEKHQALLPPAWSGDGTRRGVIHCTGYGGNAETFTTPPFDALPRRIAADRLAVASFDLSGTAHWGNDTARTRLATARTFCNTRFGFKTDKVLLIGGSMGGATALRYAIANPTLVAAIVLIIPAVDLQDIVDQNRGGYAASVTTAYGGRPSDAQNPADNAAALTGIPILAYYSTNDPICVPAATEAFLTAAGGQGVSLGAVGHTGLSAPNDDIAAFLRAHA